MQILLCSELQYFDLLQTNKTTKRWYNNTMPISTVTGYFRHFSVRFVLEYLKHIDLCFVFCFTCGGRTGSGRWNGRKGAWGW